MACSRYLLLSSANLKKRNTSGFTLIELIMSVSIIAILFSVGYANFRDFQRRKDLERAVLKIESDLRLAQELALSGRKNNCADPLLLLGYDFVIDSTTTSYTIQEVCATDPPTTFNMKTESAIFTGLGLTVSPDPTRIRFNILGRGVNIINGGGVIRVTQTSTADFREVTITGGGDIFY